MNLEKIIIGIITSLAVGAALGVLLAPKKGSKTRKKIFKKGENMTEDLEEKFHTLIAGVKDKYESLEHEAADVAKSGTAKTKKKLKEASTKGN